jgi:hypothetical protein
MTITNSSTNFGLNALRSEGFTGLGSDSSGSLVYPSDSGFSFNGIRLPEKVTSEDTTNSTTMELGPNIVSVANEGVSGVQVITLGKGFLPINILPYSLAPETGVYSRIGGVEYRAFFVNDGLPTVQILESGEALLRVRSTDSTFPTGTLATNPFMKNWSPPFIKRWKDPRNLADASYALILNNTNPSHRKPEFGNILRLNHNNVASSQTLRPGVQFDPGSSGGWGRVFKVAYSESSYRGDSPQLNEVLLNRNSGNNYYVGFNLCDDAAPWSELRDSAHGEYVTYNQRNWYAAANDQWTGVYFSSSVEPTGEVKLPPSDFNSPWAVSQSSELQVLVKDSYQGAYAPDLHAGEYEDGYYLRGAEPAEVNYGFELYYNGDNGTTNFGLLRHDVMTTQRYDVVGVISEGQLQIEVTGDLEEVPSPLRYFVVFAITNPATPNRKEYVQAIKVDKDTNELTLIRGVYGTAQESEWPDGSVLTLQVQSTEVLPQDYDFDWATSKSAILRFFEIMGYTREQMAPLLVPRERSFRNIQLDAITLKPRNGYATATGNWPLAFTTSSQVDAFSHSFHSVGRISYSRGLPRYLNNEFATKQYYDYLTSTVWGGVASVTGGDEYGNLPQSGDVTQISTGRPAGTYTSEVSDFTRINPGDSDQGGGGGGEAGVTAVYTGEGLAGGPIFKEGIISLIPPVNGEIGGVKPGTGIEIEPDGTLNLSGDVGTVESITFTGGLTGGTITTTGTVGINVGRGLFVDAANELTLEPGSVTQIGGVKTGTGTSISADGAISILPPTAAVIGGVKEGPGVNIDANGVISVEGGEAFSIRILDPLVFNGVDTDFTLTIGGTPVVPTASQYVMLVVGGVVQGTPDNYSVANSILTFSSAPPADALFYGLLFG